nr:TMV resistance protein N-like [Ipomoea batatas]GMD97494.1 TMV resistance protein N-like [Ipomoea batatas]GME15117.1 TMV resistance protein N-like [Ipomoea batatas]GME17591.1 TMV resistance protein N-like [Ipomoea batatas]
MNILKNLKGTKRIEGIRIDFEKKDDLASQKVQQINVQKRWRWASAIAHLKQSYNRHFGHAAEEEDGILNTRAFKAMANLRLLRINYAELLGNFKFFPAEMKWLQWKGCPLQCIPSEFWPRDIAVLDLSGSKITQVWNNKGLDIFRYKDQNSMDNIAIDHLLEPEKVVDASEDLGHPFLPPLVYP